ncbi:MAG: nucleotidyltransferase substrate binding protein [Alphaproteobacteria bacterium]|nr:nucleotidyltransferase substrate binding protein [Alphaproteobacteria bacterium]
MDERMEIRWKQRFENYKKALEDLADAVELATERELNFLEAKGLVARFESVHDMAVKTIADFYEEQGVTPLYGPKDIFRHAFINGLIQRGQIWMDMIKSRKQAYCLFGKDMTDNIVRQVCCAYFAEFEQLRDTLQKRSEYAPQF